MQNESAEPGDSGPASDATAPVDAAESRAPSGGARRLSRRRLWLFRALAVLLSFGLLGFVELSLRLAGFGYDTRLIVPIASPHQTYAFNPAIDRAYHGRGDLRGPEPRTFRLPKQKGVYRIVVVGGSSVAGFPYAFELSFPRQLEVVLAEQNPGQRFQVLNAGITAISSFSEVDIAKQVLACEPDLVIVHSGHNEFYGAGGLASNAGGASYLYPILERVRRQRLYQIGASLLEKPVDKHLLEALPADIQIPLNGPTFQQVAASYRGNMRQLVEAVTRRGVPLVLSSVPVNLRDLAPMSVLSPKSLGPELAKQQAERIRRIGEHLSYREFAKALAVIEEYRQDDPEDALLAYRAAQCLERLGRRDEALRAYIAAADLDGCRVRAPSAWAEIVRGVATEYAERGVEFCDAATELRRFSKLAAPGGDLFLEHVHYNLDGHWAIAQVLGEFVQTKILRETWHRERVPDESRRAALLGLTPFDQLIGPTFALMMFQVWPLKLSEDAELYQRDITTRLSQLYLTLPEEDQKRFADLSLAGIDYDPIMAMAQACEQTDRLDRALELLETLAVRQPWDERAFQRAAAIFERRRQPDAARAILSQLPQSLRFDGTSNADAPIKLTPTGPDDPIKP